MLIVCAIFTRLTHFCEAFLNFFSNYLKRKKRPRMPMLHLQKKLSALPRSCATIAFANHQACNLVTCIFRTLHQACLCARLSPKEWVQRLQSRSEKQTLRLRCNSNLRIAQPLCASSLGTGSPTRNSRFYSSPTATSTTRGPRGHCTIGPMRLYAPAKTFKLAAPGWALRPVAAWLR